MFYSPIRIVCLMRGTRKPTDTNTIGGRIRQYRESRLTQGQLAEAIGKTQKAVSAWEVGTRTPSREDVRRIADALRIAPSDIERDTVEEYRSARSMTVPVLSWVSAGKFQDVGDLVTLQRQAIDEMTVYDLPGGEWFALDVRGDSMDRISPEGSRVLVNASERTPVDGRYYIFSLRGETTFKRWRSNPDRIEPFSLNTRHEPYYPKRDRDFFCVGHVKRTYLDLP